MSHCRIKWYILPEGETNLIEIAILTVYCLASSARVAIWEAKVFMYCPVLLVSSSWCIKTVEVGDVYNFATFTFICERAGSNLRASLQGLFWSVAYDW